MILSRCYYKTSNLIENFNLKLNHTFLWIFLLLFPPTFSLQIHAKKLGERAKIVYEKSTPGDNQEQVQVFLIIWGTSYDPCILLHSLWPLIRFSISQDKIDCGISGTTQAGCEADGCCWKPVDPNPDNYPWCYKDNTVAVSIKSDLIKVLVWYSSSQMVWYSGHHLNNRLKCPLLRCFY